MGKLHLVLIIFCFLCASLVSADGSNGIFNVRDYGAKGDGVTDDTAAIRSAMKAAGSSGFCIQSPMGVYMTGGPSVIFPGGVYLISDDIPMDSFCVKGEYQALIKQTNPDKSIFISNYAWQLTIQNISFLGGKNQIDLHNPNLDTGQIVIDHCRFYNASGFAVITDVLSTTVDIKDCEFIQNAQTWLNRRCDQAIMQNCWITTDNRVENKAAIEHRAGRLTLSNICGVPLVGGANLRWIDNYGGMLTCRQFRFGGEGGGFTPVYNFTKYAENATGNSIYFDDCMFYANASYNANCTVFCKEIPNSIIINNCQYVGGKPVLFDKSLNPRDYFVNVSPKMLCFKMQNCTGELVEDMPVELKKPIIKKTPPTKKILTDKETREAIIRASDELKSKPQASTESVEDGPHKQKLNQQDYIDLPLCIVGYMDATSKKNSEYLALSKQGDDYLLIFKQKPDWAHVTADVKVDLDRYPYLTWRQKKGNAPASFAVKVIDKDTGVMKSLFAETFGGEYDYHASDLRKAFGKG